MGHEPHYVSAERYLRFRIHPISISQKRIAAYRPYPFSGSTQLSALLQKPTALAPRHAEDAGDNWSYLLRYISFVPPCGHQRCIFRIPTQNYLGWGAI